MIHREESGSTGERRPRILTARSALRFVSGWAADRTKRYWAVTLAGYILNLFAVPALALTGRWQSAIVLVFMERIGKAIRSPSRDAMLAYATSQTAQAQGAVGELAGYQTGFLVLLAPAYLAARGYSRAYWIYLAVQAATSPFLFLGRLPAAFAGMALWGISMGTQESIMRAAAADLIPSDRRATGFGMFHMAFGFAWFLGSTLMGFLYDRDVRALVAFAVGIQVLAIPLAFLANSVLVKERRQNP